MKRPLVSNWQVSVMVVLLPLLFSCAAKKDNLSHYIAEVKARPAAPIPPIPPVRTYTPYKYDGLTGRDPFRRSTSEGRDEEVVGSRKKKTSGPQPDFKRTREYLERFELDTLMMVGTFAKESYNWALIRDPDGVVHRVSVGNFIGKNHGKVGSIKRNEVELNEFIADGGGGWLARKASMALGGK